MLKAKNLFVFVAILALAIVSLAGVSAFGNISSVEINDIEADNISVFAGETLDVRVIFSAFDNADDVRIKAWIAGSSDLAASTGRFDVLSGGLYSKTLTVKVPYNIDPSEDFELHVSVESQDGVADERIVTLAAQRDSYVVDVLDVSMDTKVSAGENLILDIVLKNRGRHLAEDTFVRAKIPELGVVEKAYFGDLSAVDQVSPERDDSAERRVYLHIPVNAEPGVYDVVVEVYNADTDTTLIRKVAVVSGARDDTLAISAVQSKTGAVGETVDFSLTLVNAGDNVRVYEFGLETLADGELELSLDESFAVVPAGESRTVKISASASEAGQYSFTAKVYSGSELAKEQNFVLRAKGSKSIAGGTDAAVLLTVSLAIIFVVLLVVLIVLLTRKPQKVEEFSESYY